MTDLKDLVQLGFNSCSGMWVLLISCLLVGSVTCLPQQQGGGMYYRAYPSSGQAQYEKPSEQASGHDQYGGYSVAYNPNMATGSVSFPGYFPSTSGQQQAQPSYQSGPYYYGTSAGGGGSTSGAGSQQSSGQSGSTGAQYQVQQQGWSSSTDGDSDQEPVFTPVSEEDQVYAFKSRSRYNQKRLQFSQFSYTPTEPREEIQPVFPYHGKGSHGSKVSVKGF